jgi:hypothetical protein
MPAAAQRRAVAAATLVFPTPPLPVYRMVRGAMPAHRIRAEARFGRGTCVDGAGESIACSAATPRQQVHLTVPVRYRSLPPAIAAAAVAIAALAGCGGSSGKDAQALLRRGFAASIPSANVTVDLSAKVDGVPQLSQPIRVKLGGPYRSNGSGKLPSLNWDISLSGGGQTFSAGVISTGTQAFVNFQGTNYKVSDATVARLNASAAQRSPTGSRSLKSFGIDPLAWVKNPSEEGDSDVAGVATTHVSAGIDVAKLFNDLNKVVARAGGSVGAARPQQLTPQIIDQIKKVVHDPKFDVYVGKRDGKIRRIALSLSFDVPKQAQTTSRGVSGGNLTLSVEFAGVGEPQTIVAPANSKPISDLTKQLGGLSGALGGAAGGLGGATGSAPGAGGGGSGSGSGAADKYQRYAQCLSKAKPNDAAAIQRCAQLVK